MARIKEVKPSPSPKAKAKAKAKARKRPGSTAQSAAKIRSAKYQAAIEAAKRTYFVGRPVYFASASEQNAEKHTKFEAVYIHTAKCDGCEKHNTSVLQRCHTCSHQMCRPCMMRDKDGLHPPHSDMNWAPSTVPHTTPRNTGRLGIGVATGRIAKGGRGGRGRERGRRVEIESAESNDEPFPEVMDDEEELPISKKATKVRRQPAASSRGVKRKRPSDDDDEGIFVGESKAESEDEDDDPEYIPPIRARTTRRARKVRAQSPAIRKTPPSIKIMSISAIMNANEGEVDNSLSRNTGASPAFFEDEDFYGATPPLSPQTRRQGLTAAAGDPKTQKEANPKILEAENNPRGENAPLTQLLSRPSSSELSSLSSTPSFDYDGYIRDCETSQSREAREVREGAEALLQLSCGP